MKLYKYFPPERITFFQDLNLRFTPPAEFNDPFELRPVIASLLREEELYTEVDSMLKEVLPFSLLSNPAQMAEIKARCFREAPSYIAYANTKGRERIEASFHKAIPKNIGVLCLTESNKNLLMWSHYGASHKGLCIGFDSASSFFCRKRSEADDLGHLRRVEYDEVRKKNHLPDMEGADFLLRKGKVWGYEEEWRMCALLKDADKVSEDQTIHLFTVPSSAVLEVILGVNMDEGDRDKVIGDIKTNADLKHIEIYQAEISKKEFKLHLTKL